MTEGELIEQYLTNRLDERGRQAFEKELKGSPKLREEVALQQQIIDGIQATRAKELKDMLKATNVSLSQQTYPILKNYLLAAALSIGITGLVLYLTTTTWNPNSSSTHVSTDSSHHTPATTNEGSKFYAQNGTDSSRHTPATTNTTTPPDHSAGIIIDSTKNISQNVEEGKKIVSTHHEVASNKKQPRLAPKNLAKPVPPPIPSDEVNPTKEINTPARESIQSPPNSTPLDVNNFQTLIKVELDTTNIDYSFHYRFARNKLFLYGPFKADLYDLIALKKGDSVAYLYYKGKYYTLHKGSPKIKKLKEIQSDKLLEMLKKKQISNEK